MRWVDDDENMNLDNNAPATKLMVDDSRMVCLDGGLLPNNNNNDGRVLRIGRRMNGTIMVELFCGCSLLLLLLVCSFSFFLAACHNIFASSTVVATLLPSPHSFI